MKIISSVFIVLLLISCSAGADENRNDKSTVKIKDYKANINIKNGVLYIKSVSCDKNTNICYVQIILDYSIPTGEYESDETSYSIAILRKKYYKYGGFEYDGNMCSGKRMHYESEFTVSHEANIINPDLWPSVKADYIAEKIYEYLIKNNISCK